MKKSIVMFFCLLGLYSCQKEIQNPGSIAKNPDTVNKSAAAVANANVNVYVSGAENRKPIYWRNGSPVYLTPGSPRPVGQMASLFQETMCIWGGINLRQPLLMGLLIGEQYTGKTIALWAWAILIILKTPASQLQGMMCIFPGGD